MIFLDTNAVIYLYTGSRSLSERAVLLINRHDCRISPLVKLELLYLYDIGRLTKKPDIIAVALSEDIGLEVHDQLLGSIVTAAASLSWTRDPFDRLIVAQAKINDSYLVTSDRTILEHYKKAIW